MKSTSDTPNNLKHVRMIDTIVTSLKTATTTEGTHGTFGVTWNVKDGGIVEVKEISERTHR